MADVAGTCAALLTILFGLAGLMKLANRDDTARSFAGLGLPAPRALAWVLPFVEMGLSSVILVTPSVGGWLAVALLIAFSAVLARAIARGSGAPCACFGSARRAPVSTTEIVRNAMLAAVAIVATGATRQSQLTLASILVVGLAVALGRVVLAVLDLRRTTGRLWPRLPDQQVPQ
jgi:uncharacterized membrane protein YphA (DoxX/SURF4 family)